MDFVGGRNIHAAKAAASLSPVSNLTLTLDYLVFWLADSHDYFYAESGRARNSNGYGANPQNGYFVGSELELDASYTLNSWARHRAGYGHFFVGNYARKSLDENGGARDADWLYAQITLDF